MKEICVQKMESENMKRRGCLGDVGVDFDIRMGVK